MPQRSSLVRFFSVLLDPLGLRKGQFVGNAIRTSKYTLITFLPLNLFEQFKRVANLYFAFMIALQVGVHVQEQAWDWLNTMCVASIAGATFPWRCVS